MIKVKYSGAAIRDLDQIGDYIAKKLNNPQAALNTVNGIQDKIDKLTEFPFMGIPLSSIYDTDIDYRFLVCGNYLAFYRSQKKIVFIDRVLYGKRDYIQILFGEEV